MLFGAALALLGEPFHDDLPSEPIVAALATFGGRFEVFLFGSRQAKGDLIVVLGLCHVGEN
jgi:hypothetical protein